MSEKRIAENSDYVDDLSPTGVSQLYMLVSELSQKYMINVKKRLVKFKCKAIGQKKLLFCIARADREQGISQFRLAEETQLTHSTTTNDLAVMEFEELSYRRIDAKDARLVHTYITDKGRRHLELLEQAYTETEKRMLRGISAADKRTARRIMKRMLDNLMEAEREEVEPLDTVEEEEEARWW